MSGSRPRNEHVRRQQQRRENVPRTRTSKVTTFGALIGVAALIVSTSLPAAVLYPRDSAFALAMHHTPLRDSPTQTFAANTEAALAVPALLGRDGYAVTLPPPPKPASQARVANFTPIGSLLYSPNPNGTIRWPFPRYVPIASGFGLRVAPCTGCSSYHDGLDFLPGAGAPIGAIAPGVVSAAGPATGGYSGYGTRVIVDHIVNGQKVQSLYAHMIAGSHTVAVGDTVTVGQTLGLVGNTGASTGAHLHLGISLDGIFIDPFAWLVANAN